LFEDPILFIHYGFCFDHPILLCMFRSTSD
jgi:hypothetical protein